MPTRSVQIRSCRGPNFYGCSQEQVDSALRSLFMGGPAPPARVGAPPESHGMDANY